MRLMVEIAREADARFLAEVSALQGVMAYGATADEATEKAEALALRVLAERVEHREPLPKEIEPLFSIHRTAPGRRSRPPACFGALERIGCKGYGTRVPLRKCRYRERGRRETSPRLGPNWRPGQGQTKPLA
jgi:predicted RNase H-like HicB family nuclease